MENHQVVKRRVNMIANHLSTLDHDISSLPTHLFPMSCSSSWNSVIRRCDNRMYYARQSSTSQAPFMRLSSSDQQGSITEPSFPVKPNDCGKKSFDGPMFSRPTRTRPHNQTYNEVGAEPPKFARPSTGINAESHFQLKETTNKSNGNKWSPRMDVAESRCMYIISVELAGVNVNDIKVEISDTSLIVSGNRSAQLKEETCSNAMGSTYHKREIVHGPYQVFWPLPINANKDSVTAEFVDGLLQITVPKLSETRRPIRKHV